MKHIYLLLLLTISLIACSKDEFDRTNPKNGQEVELFVDHYTAGGDPMVFISDNRGERLYASVENFSEREIGYTYLLKAKVVVPPQPFMDGPSYWFERIKTIRKDKFQGQDTFALPLFGSWLPSPFFCLTKDAGKFMYYSSYDLTPANDAVRIDLDTALARGPVMLRTFGPKWMSIHVKHDPDNYSKGYIVYGVDF